MGRSAKAALGMAIVLWVAVSAWPATGAHSPAEGAGGAVSAAGAPGADAGSPTARGSRARIAHVINTGGLESVALIRADGRGFEVVRRSAGDPAWSPDGTMLAVGERRGEDSDIAVLEADGSGFRRLTSGAGADHSPAFSPDGRLLAFSRVVRGPRGELRASIHVVGADGTGLRRLTGGRVFDRDPRWSPDGRLIAFSRSVADRRGRPSRSIVLYDVAREDWRRVATGAASPAFSPDGRRLAYVSYRDDAGRTCFQECTGSGEIHVMSLDGTRDVRVTRSRADDAEPAWAPGGRTLVFSSDRADPSRHDYELHSMSDAGRCTTRLTNSSSWSRQPAVEPTSAARLPCDADGLAPGARTPRSDVDVTALRGFESYTVFWLGRSHRGLLLGHAEHSTGGFDDSVGLVYDDCGRIARRCPAGIQVQTRPLCWHVDGPVRARLRRIGSERGAPVYRSPGPGGEDGWMEVHTGNAAVRVIAGSPRDAWRAIARVRALDGRVGRLATPARRCR